MQAYAGVIFCGRVPTREYAGGLLSRTFLSLTFWKRELPHLHGHIFPFIGTSFPSQAYLPLHSHIFPFREVGGGGVG